MDEIDQFIARLSAIVTDLRARNDPAHEVLIYLTEMALAEARDLKNSIKRRVAP